MKTAESNHSCIQNINTQFSDTDPNILCFFTAGFQILRVEYMDMDKLHHQEMMAVAEGVVVEDQEDLEHSVELAIDSVTKVD